MYIPVVYGLNDPSKDLKSDFVGLINTIVVGKNM